MPFCMDKHDSFPETWLISWQTMRRRQLHTSSNYWVPTINFQISLCSRVYGKICLLAIMLTMEVCCTSAQATEHVEPQVRFLGDILYWKDRNDSNIWLDSLDQKWRGAIVGKTWPTTAIHASGNRSPLSRGESGSIQWAWQIFVMRRSSFFSSFFRFDTKLRSQCEDEKSIGIFMRTPFTIASVTVIVPAYLKSFSSYSQKALDIDHQTLISGDCQIKVRLPRRHVTLPWTLIYPWDWILRLDISFFGYLIRKSYQRKHSSRSLWCHGGPGSMVTYSRNYRSAYNYGIHDCSHTCVWRGYVLLLVWIGLEAMIVLCACSQTCLHGRLRIRVAANRKIFQMPNVRNLSDIENLLLKPTIHAARPLVLRYVAIK